MRSTLHTSQTGFTLIEMIVSLGVFAVVVTITTGALLMLIATNQRYQFEQNIMSNLSFAVDSMTREMRMGYNYSCRSAGNASTSIFGLGAEHESIGNSTTDCVSGRQTNAVHGVSFYESGNSITGDTSNRILYFYHADTKKLYRRVGDNPAQQLTSDSVQITNADFFVTDTAPGGRQPTITIYLKARATDDTATTPRTYSIQTTVSQRMLDI